MPVSHPNTQTYLISCQDPERCHNLLSGVRVSSLSGHKVNERLERDNSCRIGVHQHHYTGKLHLSLRKARINSEQTYYKNHVNSNILCSYRFKFNICEKEIHLHSRSLL